MSIMGSRGEALARVSVLACHAWPTPMPVGRLVPFLPLMYSTA